MNSTKLSFLIILSFAMVYSLQDEKDPIVNYSALENPFRSQKCNLLWDKARYGNPLRKYLDLFRFDNHNG